MSILVKLNNISKSYTLGNTCLHALEQINLQIAQGEMVAIVGASGSGKSTLMNILGCLDRATSGHYFLQGQDVSRLSDDELADLRNRQLGFVFQSFYLLPRITALQNVMLPLFYRGVPFAEAKEMALAQLTRVSMARFSHHKPNQLSGGQQQRVAIARALVGNPGLILADEPTGALDYATGQEVMKLFLQLHADEGRSIVIVTHDREVSRLCQREIILRDGKMV